LALEYMPGVTDVSMLGSVHNLILFYMPGVTDVSMLRSVHNLKLAYMNGVTDVSMLLNKSGTMSVCHCRHLADVKVSN